MDLGATRVHAHASPTAPRARSPPIASRCTEDRIAELPSPRPAKALPQRAVRVLLIERGGEILFEQRPPLGIWGGLWSLPELRARRRRARGGADALRGRRRRARRAAADRAWLHALRADAASAARARARRWPARAEAPGTLWLAPADARGAALPAPIKKLMRSLER